MSTCPLATTQPFPVLERVRVPQEERVVVGALHLGHDGGDEAVAEGRVARPPHRHARLQQLRRLLHVAHGRVERLHRAVGAARHEAGKGNENAC